MLNHLKKKYREGKMRAGKIASIAIFAGFLAAAGISAENPLASKKVVQALVAGFCEALNLTLVPGKLTPRERAQAADLRTKVYTDPRWTTRR